MRTDRIGLLFLVIDGLSQPEIWRRFLANQEGKYAAYTHAKFPHRVGLPFLRDTLIPEYVPTHHSKFYPHDVLVGAQLALLRHAIGDERIEKFMFATQTCVPICSFNKAYEALLSDDQSWVECHQPLWPDRYAMLAPDSGIAPDQFGTSSCWIALNRRHAQILLAAAPEWLPRFATVPAADEHFAPTLLKMAGCEDECKRYNPTHVDWSRGNPYTYEHVTAEDVRQLSRGPYLLARKFSPTSDIAAVWDEIVRQRKWDSRGESVV
ncbi:MAG: beta-1,6-N-acetylglucosaminyltransferase [Thermoguttaceae bacterium]